MNKDLILGALPGLDKTSLKEIRARASFLLGKDEETEQPDLSWYGGPSGELFCSLGKLMPQFFPKGRRSLYPALKKEVDRVAVSFSSMANEFRPGHLPEQIRSRLIVIRCCMQYLERRELPVTPMMVLKQGRQLGAVIEEAFPGYLMGGMLPAILKRTRQAV